MAEEANSETTSGAEEKGGNATRTAVKAAAAAAATGAAAVAVKKALDSRSNGGSSNGEGSSKSGNGQSFAKSVASGSWDAAQDALVPLAADAAAAAGKYLAESGPDVVKEQIVPRFIEAFNEAG